MEGNRVGEARTRNCGNGGGGEGGDYGSSSVRIYIFFCYCVHFHILLHSHCMTIYQDAADAEEGGVIIEDAYGGGEGEEGGFLVRILLSVIFT